MINDAVGRASLLPRLSSARNKVYPCTRYGPGYLVVFSTASIPASLPSPVFVPRCKSFISAYDPSNSAQGSRGIQNGNRGQPWPDLPRASDSHPSFVPGRFNWVSFPLGPASTPPTNVAPFPRPIDLYRAIPFRFFSFFLFLFFFLLPCLFSRCLLGGSGQVICSITRGSDIRSCVSLNSYTG